ncbi:MAG: TlpA family protein disulfide reductase [Actinobacteria bacterium]|nr:TlpA family protein disulfide reductase [Actinomycetota bacterium]
MGRRALLTAATVAAVVAAGCGGAPPATCVDVPSGRGCVDVIDGSHRRAAPDTTVGLVGGGDASLSDLRGRTVVLNFWASWCGPCRAEQPDLNEAHRQLAGDDVAFLGVNLQDSESNAQAYIREFAIPYPSLFDPSTSFTAQFEGVGPQAIPTTIVIDRDGRVAARLFGTTTAGELAAVVRHVVGEHAAP